MIYKEEQRDLFSVPHGYYFAHCISGDYALGAGIAVEFDKLYDMKNKLKRQWSECGDANEALLVDNVFNLVTKRKCYKKPTYDSLREALEDLVQYTADEEVTKIAMPKIGCGLDGLDWNIVSQMIQEIFEDTDIEILVCYI